MAVFGQAMNRRKGVSNYQRQMGKSGSKQNNYSSSNPTQSQTDDAKKAAFIQEQKRKRALQSQTLDTKSGTTRLITKALSNSRAIPSVARSSTFFPQQ